MFRIVATTICLVILGCLAPATSSAQSFNVKNFSCTTTPLGVNVDVSGIGHTNLCVTGTAQVNLSCACAGNGGNCTSDSKKAGGSETLSSSQSFEPKNGRVQTTFFLTPAPSNADCEGPAVGLQCGGGQDATLIKWTTADSQPEFSVCSTTSAPGTPCTCGTALDTISCGPEGATPNPGKHNSCSSLFP